MSDLNSSEALMRLKQFLAAIHAQHVALQRARKLTEDRLAPDFSPFEFIETDELGLSQILAWVLNPKGSHGQGDRFLTAFLQHLGTPWEALGAKGAVVRTEALTYSIGWPNRRIDILIRCGESWTLAIENKPWAGDQPAQVKDYLDHLDELGGQHRSLVYLSGPGAEPSDESIASDERERRRTAGQLHLWSYEGLVPWLETCKGRCSADRVTVFLDQFIHYIQRTFMGVRDVAEQEQIVRTVLQSVEATEGAMLVIENARRIRLELLSKLVEQMQKATASIGWRVSGSFELGRYQRFYVDFAEAADHQFALEVANTAGVFRPVYWGVRAKNSKVASVGLRRAVQKALGPGQHNPEWPWFKAASLSDPNFPVEADWEQSASPWVMIAKGEMHPLVIEAATRIRDILQGQGLLPQAPVAPTNPPSGPADPAMSAAQPEAEPPSA